MNDNVEKWWRYSKYVTSKWRKDINVPHYESPKEIRFRFSEFLRGKNDDV